MTKKPKKNEEVEKLKGEFQSMTEAAKRAIADLANYKRRVEEEQKNFVEYASSGLVFELLPVLDNFERAFEHMPEDENSKEFCKGIFQIYDHLKTTLQKVGLEEIRADKGDVFDHNFHEALMQGPGTKDTIVESCEKGYRLGKRVLRPAKVKVGNGE
ncbi:MAG: nucleotide exchange factor GrpE [Patescibacteria group bacterium]|nr:nucleotide exchange factor GrpE [Patescibacteria group bacterium]